MNQDLVQTFCTAFAKVAGKPHAVTSVEEAAAIVAAVAKARNTGPVALANMPAAWMAVVAAHCRAAGVGVLEPPYAGADVAGQIDAAAVGVTGMAFGIAQTGTLVEVTEDDAARLVSSLPRLHIGLVAAETLVGAYHDAAGPLRAILSDPDRPCTVSFISGPSRTGDIELKLTLGVHGPEEAHAIIIQSATP